MRTTSSAGQTEASVADILESIGHAYYAVDAHPWTNRERYETNLRQRGLLDVRQPRERLLEVRVALGRDLALVRLLAVLRVELQSYI